MKKELKLCGTTPVEFTDARALAQVMNGAFRAPHHTVRDQALIEELAASAGGVLWLDAAHLFSGYGLVAVCRTWANMHPSTRPVVFFSTDTVDAKWLRTIEHWFDMARSNAQGMWPSKTELLKEVTTRRDL